MSERLPSGMGILWHECSAMGIEWLKSDFGFRILILN